MDKSKLRLYLVTDSSLTLSRSLEQTVMEAVRGGVCTVQLREKKLGTREFVQRAIRLREILSPLGVPLIINDRIDVALASGADGVHIGQSDMPYALARKLMGSSAIVGLSVENLSQVLEANALDVDYIAVSPVFSTTTKTDTAAPFGLEGLEQAARLSRHPIVAIGGMNAGTAFGAISHGADGIAVVSAVMCAQSPFDAARELIGIIGK